jgi:hypothetical protein
VQQCTFPFPQAQVLIDRGDWMAVSSSGDVTSRAPGADTASWVPVHRGDRVESLSLVKATGRGQATLTRNGDVILVSPGTELTLPEGDVSGDVIRQDGGKALYKVKPGREGRRFEVVTPMLVAGVKGTGWTCSRGTSSRCAATMGGWKPTARIAAGRTCPRSSASRK